MQKHLDKPSSPAWHARRAACFNAGDASAMLDCHPSGKTRTELLTEIHTGLQREFSDYVQERVIDPGHVIEAALRPIAEEILDEELEVPSYSLPVAGLSRPLGASLDGAVFLGDTNWECKSANEALRAALPHTGRDSHTRNDARHLPKGYRVQMEQQLMASPAKRTLFSVGLVDANGKVTEERHAFYAPDLELRAEILAGWRQFDADLAVYVPAAPTEKVRAEPVEDFPVMEPITMTGDVAVQHKLDSFKVKLKAHIEQLPKDPKTDQEFANLEDSVKRRDALEKALKAERERALRGSPNIAQLLTAIDELLALSRETRLADADKVSAKKEAMRLEIRNAAQADFDAHVRGWNERLGRPLLSTSKGTCPDAAIAQGMHGKKSVKGWREGAAAAVNQAKITVTLLAEKVAANVATYTELCAGSEALFRDIDALLFKDTEAFRVICAGRIEEAKRQEAARLDAERERIRKEEAAKLVAEEQARADAQAAAAPAATPTPAPEVATAAPQAAASAPTVIPMPARAAAPTSKPTLSLGQIKERIAPLQITADGMAQLGFTGLKDRGSVLFHEADYPHVLAAIVAHVQAIQAKQAA